MPPDVVIRKAVPADLPALLDIYNYEISNGTATFDIHPQTLEQRRKWYDAHQSEKYMLLVADERGKAVGYATLSPYRDKDAYAGTAELSVYVASDHRRQGIAVMLMDSILRLAKECPGLSTVISVITAGNEASEKLHHRFGFRYCGTIPDIGEKFGRMLSIENYTLSVK